jgi:Predicted transcriptional regulators
MDIGQRIVELRTRLGWTTNFLANRCGLSQSFLRSVEIGEKGISVEKLEYICDAMDVSLKTFFDIPSEEESIDKALCRRIEILTEEQKTALLKLLDVL